MTTKSPFPDLIDNTMRGDFVLCKKKFYWGFVEKWAPMSPSVHLHAGGAFAAGLESARRSFYEQGKPLSEALRAGLEALMRYYGDVQFPETRSGDKSLENVIRAFDSYFERYSMVSDLLKPFRLPNGKVMVEFSFAIPTEVVHPVSGNPILYGGRSDMIAMMNESLFVTDEKTASALGESWAAQWDLESQFTGYVAAAKMYGYPAAGAVVRGVGLLKTKITHQEVIVYRGQWVIDRWWEQVNRDIRAMVAAWKEGYWDMALSKNACAAYGGCAFKKLCESPEPEQWLQLNYRQRTWNPLAKDMGENLLENPEVKKMLAGNPQEIDLKDLM